MSASLTMPDRGAAPPRGKWKVLDSNARVVVDGKVQGRVHEIRPGVFYTLFYNEGTAMPEEDARKFLIDKSFIVTDPDGERVAPLSEQATLRELPNRLKANQVIADLNELTQDALLNRALQKPNAPKFNGRSKRDMLVEFLLSAHEAEGGGGGPMAGTDDDDAAELEEAEDADVDAILQGR